MKIKIQFFENLKINRNESGKIYTKLNYWSGIFIKFALW